MAQTLKINNFDSINILAQTLLTADMAASANALTVANTADFSTAGPVVVGQLGVATAELLTSTTPSVATSLPLSSATKLAHNFNDPVTLLFGNQIRIYRANDTSGNGTQPADSTFTLITTLNIDGSQAQTSYTDSAGATGNWYKFTYFNSSTSAETQLADSVAVQAGQVHYVSIDQIRSSAGLDGNTHITNGKIAEYRDAAEREVNGALGAVYSLPLPQPTNPIVVQITKNIAAGELMHDVYTTTSPTLAQDGENKANKARNGGGPHTSLMELVTREVVLQDANFLELTIEEAHGFGGWPDATTYDHYTLGNTDLGRQGMDHGAWMWVDKEY